MMPTLTRKVRVAGSAWGATSRTRLVALSFGSSVRAISTTGSRGAVRRIWAGTSKTASRPAWSATSAIVCPARTTSPGQAPTAVTEPAASALSSV